MPPFYRLQIQNGASLHKYRKLVHSKFGGCHVHHDQNDILYLNLHRYKMDNTAPPELLEERTKMLLEVFKTYKKKIYCKTCNDYSFDVFGLFN